MPLGREVALEVTTGSLLALTAAAVVVVLLLGGLLFP